MDFPQKVINGKWCFDLLSLRNGSETHKNTIFCCAKQKAFESAMYHVLGR
jgi:hypothetical protein